MDDKATVYTTVIIQRHSLRGSILPDVHGRIQRLPLVPQGQVFPIHQPRIQQAR